MPRGGFTKTKSRTGVRLLSNGFVLGGTLARQRGKSHGEKGRAGDMLQVAYKPSSMAPLIPVILATHRITRLINTSGTCVAHVPE